MKTINGAKLEITVLIDQDQLNEMKANGVSEKDIENAIKKAITLTEVNVRQPVFSIESIELIKYY